MENWNWNCASANANANAISENTSTRCLCVWWGRLISLNAEKRGCGRDDFLTHIFLLPGSVAAWMHGWRTVQWFTWSLCGMRFSSQPQTVTDSFRQLQTASGNIIIPQKSHYRKRKDLGNQPATPHQISLHSPHTLIKHTLWSIGTHHRQ